MMMKSENRVAAAAVALALLGTAPPAHGQVIDALGSAAVMNDTDVFPVCQPACTVANPALKMTAALAAAYVYSKVHGAFTIASDGTISSVFGPGILYAQIQNVTPLRLLGNPTGSLAPMSEISLGASLTFSSSTLGTAALSGDVTSAANSFVTTIAANAVTNAKLAAATQNTVKGAATSTAEADLAMPSCSTGAAALIWTTSTGFGCLTGVANLATTGQVVTGGATVTALALATGSVTINCGNRPLQTITNGGPFTITAPASDGSCLLLVTNNATAGAIAFSGFAVGALVGDALTTTNLSKFSISIWRINGTPGYRIAAHQ